MKPQSIDTEAYNNLLRRLRPDDFTLLAPHLDQRLRPVGDLLYSPGDNVEFVYFPCGPSLVSYLVTNEDGRDVRLFSSGAREPSAVSSASVTSPPIAGLWSNILGPWPSCA